jgi:uncharacterized membrane protein YfcA
MSFLYSIPPVVLLLSAILLALVFAAGGQLYVHRRFREHDFAPHNEVGGFIIAVVGTLYAVLLGFLTVTAWQHFSEARDLVALESASAADAWHTALGLPAAPRSRVRTDVLAYANAMLAHDWPDMRVGRVHPIADIIVMDAIGAAGNFVPKNPRESNAQAATLQQLGTLHDYRQRRIFSSLSGVSWFEWLILLIGAVCVICFCWLFGSSNPRAHLLMTSAVAIIVAAILVLLFELQYPFRSAVGIGTFAWQATIEHIHLMQTGGQASMRM